jgi:hypothetical protein
MAPIKSTFKERRKARAAKEAEIQSCENDSHAENKCETCQNWKPMGVPETVEAKALRIARDITVCALNGHLDELCARCTAPPAPLDAEAIRVRTWLAKWRAAKADTEADRLENKRVEQHKNAKKLEAKRKVKDEETRNWWRTT